jgi:hypothetical protein
MHVPNQLKIELKFGIPILLFELGKYIHCMLMQWSEPRALNSGKLFYRLLMVSV